MAAGQIFQDGDVYILTFKGSKELQGSETGLAALPLELLVQIDGRATTGEIRARMKTLTDDARFDAAMRQLVAEGYVDIASNLMTVSPDFIEFFSATSKPPSDSALDQAQSAASSGITTLQRHGYYVRIAMRGSGAAHSGQIRVLVVEDDETLSKFLRQYLELEGFAATVAGNRAEIIAGLRQQPPPDLVLLDVMLPGVSGFDVCADVRGDPSLAGTKILMMTAGGSGVERRRGMAAGADGFITKPFELGALRREVRRLIAG